MQYIFEWNVTFLRITKKNGSKNAIGLNLIGQIVFGQKNCDWTKII